METKKQNKKEIKNIKLRKQEKFKFNSQIFNNKWFK